MTTEELFLEKFPNVFPERPRCGFDLPPGWVDLVECLCWVLEGKIKRLPESERPSYRCVQVKEKFAGLRFYMEAQTPEMDAAIQLAEAFSFHLCEECGKPGKPQHAGWSRTLCGEHAKR